MKTKLPNQWARQVRMGTVLQARVLIKVPVAATGVNEASPHPIFVKSYYKEGRGNFVM